MVGAYTGCSANLQLEPSEYTRDGFEYAADGIQYTSPNGYLLTLTLYFLKGFV